MTVSSSGRLTRTIPDLSYRHGLKRNLISRLLTTLAAMFAVIAVLPLIAVLGYVLIKGGEKLSLSLFTLLPPPPGLDGGGIGNAVLGSIVVTALAAQFPWG